MNNPILLNKNDPRIEKFVKGYKGRRPIQIRVAENYHVSNYWDGGSKETNFYYDFSNNIYINSKQAGVVKQTVGNPFNLDIGNLKLRPGLMVITKVIFQGKDLGYRFTIHHDDKFRFM